jgi:PAS domain-containing protein
MSSEENKSGEQKGAEAEVESFRKNLGPFVVAAETTRMAMVFTDANASDNPVIFANDSFLSLTGYDREEVLGQSLNFLMARGALIRSINEHGRMNWQKASGFNRRSKVEAAISCYKRVIGDALRSREDARRVCEVKIAVKGLNRMLELGRPICVRVA